MTMDTAAPHNVSSQSPVYPDGRAGLGMRHGRTWMPAAAAGVVFGVDLEVRGQLVDAAGDQRNLNFGASGVVGSASEFLHEFGFFGFDFGRTGHGYLIPYCFETAATQWTQPNA